MARGDEGEQLRGCIKIEGGFGNNNPFEQIGQFGMQLGKIIEEHEKEKKMKRERFKGSQMVKKKEDIEWLVSQIPEGAKEVKMIYNQREDGFKQSDFHSKCDGHPHPTFTLLKSKAGKIFGGFTKGKWSSSGGHVKGTGSFIFSLDLKKVFPQQTENTIYCDSEFGPSFGGNCLAIGNNMDAMYGEDQSRCQTNGFNSGKNYLIPTDDQGNNIVTGEGSNQQDDDKRFTCVDIEVFSVIY